MQFINQEKQKVEFTCNGGIIMECNEVEIKESPITVYPNIAYPLMLILKEEYLKEWYYEQFVNIYSQCWDKTLFRIDFLDSSRYFGDVIECNSLTINDAKDIDIVDYVIDQINKGYCLNVFAVDEFFVSDSNAYKKKHYIHETLIYGYDNKSKVFKVVGYDKQENFTKFTYKIEEFAKAFKGAINNPPYYLVDALHSIKIRHFFCNYIFSMDNFVTELERYIYSIPDYKKKYFSLASEDLTSYGISVYDEMINKIEEKINGNHDIDITYLCFHFIYEHKLMIIERLKFIKSKYIKGSYYDELIDRYEKIVAKSNSIRINFLKKAWVESNFKNRMRVNNKEYLRSIEKQINCLKTEEFDVLQKVYTHLKNMTDKVKND